MLSKALWIAGGITGLATLAYFYESWNKRSKKKYIEFNRKIKELPTLRAPGGNLNLQAMAKFIHAVSEEAEKEVTRVTQRLTRQRRKLLKEEDYDEYLELCQEYLDLQREIEEDYLKKGLDKLGIEREEYEEEIAKIPPQTMQMIMKAKSSSKSTEDAPLPYTLTKSKTKEIYLEIMELQDRSNEKWQTLLEKLESLVITMDQMTGGTIMMGVMQLLIVDILYNEYKLTEEQYSAAIQQHKIMEDPEVFRKMQHKAAMYKMMMMMNQGQ